MEKLILTAMIASKHIYTQTLETSQSTHAIHSNLAAITILKFVNSMSAKANEHNSEHSAPVPTTL
jgi:hypothetical protein